MNELREALEEYLMIRRSLGFELRLLGRCLSNFVTFMEDADEVHITTELALQWAKQPTNVQTATLAWRLGMVRIFAAWRIAADPHTEVPPKGLIPYQYHRKPPYIYTDEEIEGLIRAARALPSAKGLRAHTYATLFGLLAVTGMRVSESLGLDREDVDLEAGIITIIRTKFGKSRLVFVHTSTCEVLTDYADMRDHIHPTPRTPGFFVSEQGTRITEWMARYTFAKVSRQIGLREPVEGNRHGHGPRLHDMRHRFAARTLINWYRAGVDVECEMPKLSAYLGHVHVSDTYWYLEAVPELLQLATDRLVEAHMEVES